MARDLVQSGLALWEDTEERQERLIVKGRSNLLSESAQQEDLDRIKNLFDDLERKRDIADFLELTEKGERKFSSLALTDGLRPSSLSR